MASEPALDILVVTREYPPDVLGGISYHLAELYDRIAERGHSVTVIAGTCAEATAVDIETASEIEVERVPFGTRRGHHVSFSLAAFRRLRRMDMERFDVAVTHTPFPFELDLPVVGKYHDCAPAEREYDPERSLGKRLLDTVIDPTRDFVNQRSFDTVDCAIFNSRLCRAEWDKRYDLPADTRIHYNGVDTDTFYPRECDDDDYVLFVGDSERKGLSRVLEFASKSSYPVYIAGVSDVDSTNVTSLGHVPQDRLAELYSGATSTIHPARFEAFGNVVLESLACGTPVVTTEQCGASELLDGRSGVVTDNIERGVDRAKVFETEACISVAKSHEWDSAAEEMVRVLWNIS